MDRGTRTGFPTSQKHRLPLGRVHSDPYPSSTQGASGALHAGLGAVLRKAAGTSESRRNAEGESQGPLLPGAGREDTRALPELNVAFVVAMILILTQVITDIDNKVNIKGYKRLYQHEFHKINSQIKLDSIDFREK